MNPRSGGVSMNVYAEELQHIIQTKILQSLSGSHILLSGATGMIGKCMVDLIMLYNKSASKPIDITTLSRNEETARARLKSYFREKRFHYQACDVNQPIPELGNFDYIIHAASNTHPLQYANDSIGTITSNVSGTKNLLDYANAHQAKRFCFVSSVEIYGENRGDTEQFDENYLGYLNCNTLRAGYPESKRLGETLCNAYYRTYGLDFVIPRLSRCYGPTALPTDSKALSQFINKAKAGENIVLKSEGKQKYSYTFVTDAVSGILFTLINGKSGEAYNIKSDESDITLRELAEILADFAKSNVVFELPKAQEKAGYSTATKAMLDTAKLRQLGWKSRVSITEGLKCTLCFDVP